LNLIFFSHPSRFLRRLEKALKEKEKCQIPTSDSEDENVNLEEDAPKANCPLLPSSNHSVENLKHKISRQQRVSKVYKFEMEKSQKNMFDDDYASD
jgi:hypothetical protein